MHGLFETQEVEIDVTVTSFSAEHRQWAHISI